MYKLNKCIIVTNNDRAYEKWNGIASECYMVDSYEEVLEKTRDFIHLGHKILTHPQASSLKPNQTPYRTVILYGEKEGYNMDDVLLIEKAIETFRKWKEVKKTPSYTEKIDYDYKTIDLSMIENIIPRL